MDSVCILIRYSGRLNELGFIPLKRKEASVLKNKHHYNKLPDLVAIFSTNLIQIEIKGRERFKILLSRILILLMCLINGSFFRYYTSILLALSNLNLQFQMR